MKIHDPKKQITSLSWAGEPYEADADGVFDLPAEALADLQPFGLEAIPEPPEAGDPADEPAGPISRWPSEALKVKAAELGLQLPEDIKRQDLVKAVSEAMKAQEGA